MSEAELEEMDRPRLMAVCDECGASIAACNEQATARRLAEAYYREQGLSGSDARSRAASEYPELCTAAS